MGYFKAVYDGLILDVYDEKDMVYIRDDPFAGKVRCAKGDNPFGVLSSDGGVIYALHAREGYQEVSLIAFDDATEYDTLRAELDAQHTPEYVEPEEPEDPDPDDQTEAAMSASEIRVRIVELQEKLNAVTAQNEMLTECLLEMSEVVYGE